MIKPGQVYSGFMYNKSKEIAAAKMIYKKGIKGYPQALMGLGVSGSKRLSLKMANMVKM